MSQGRFVTATFDLLPGTPKTLTVAKDGSGAGSVTVVYSGGLSDCFFSAAGGTCSRVFANGTRVTLSPTSAAGSTFAGWSGDCSGTAGCTLTMDQDHSATATFALVGATPGRKTLTVTKTGNGSGTVASIPGAIDCGATCAREFDQGTVVTLSATPANGSTFAGWSGDCSGAAATCTVTMDTSRSATANFQTSFTPPPTTKAKCVVPKVKGKTLAAAKRALVRAKCAMGKLTRAYSAKVTKGLVISQRPAAGKSLTRGAKVALVVSNGKHH